MRRAIAVAALAAAALTALAVPADAAQKPTIRQIMLFLIGPAADGSYKGVDAAIARTDHKSPKGVWVCIQERNWNLPTQIKTIGCATATKYGEVLVRHHLPVPYNGEQWRTYHPETKTLAKHYGAWSYGQ